MSKLRRRNANAKNEIYAEFKPEGGVIKVID
jgi:hypothetical protein